MNIYSGLIWPRTTVEPAIKLKRMKRNFIFTFKKKTFIIVTFKFWYKQNFYFKMNDYVYLS